MKSGRFDAWLHSIYATQDDEISCTECFDLVSGVVELELAGGDAASRFPMVLQHLGQCRACRDEYELLREVARLDDESN